MTEETYLGSGRAPTGGTPSKGGEPPSKPRYLPTYEGCYVCGQAHPRGLRIRFFTTDDGRVLARFRPDATQTGYDDIVHGGVTSALLDELIGWSVSLSHGLLAYTAELRVRFVKPMHAGTAYLASSGLKGGRGRYWEAEGEVRGDEGEVYGTGSGKYYLLTAEQTDQVARRMSYQPGDLRVFHQRAGG